jgi:hypothetical protein
MRLLTVRTPVFDHVLRTCADSVILGAVLGACAGASPTAPPSVPASATTTTAPATAPPPSGSPEPELTFAVLDACAILPQKDAERIAATPLETGQPGNPLNPSCSYNGPITGPLAQVQIFIGDGAKKTYDIDVELKHEFKDVAGIGDEAHQENNAIFVRKGTTWVAIELVRLNDPAENVKALQDAAKKVVAALP